MLCGTLRIECYALIDLEQGSRDTLLLAQVSQHIARLSTDVHHHTLVEGGSPEIHGVTGWYDLQHAVTALEAVFRP